MDKLISLDPPAIRTSQIKEPVIQILDIDNVCHFAKEINHSPLTIIQKKEVSDFLSTNPSILTLCNLIKHFLQIKESYELYSGLGDDEKNQLNELLNTRRKLKNNMEKNAFIIKEAASFIDNEKKIVPLSKKIQYWAINSDSLKKLDLWENISLLTKKESDKNGESLEIAKNRLYKLSDIKNEWSSHQTFSKYSSESLRIFYQDYICELESSIRNILTSSNTYPDIVVEYIGYTLHQIVELKKQAIYSMLYRLYCAEYFNDLMCDDLLLYTTQKIDTQCNINTRGVGLKPAARRSLNTALLSDFIKNIEEYTAQNEKENFIFMALNELKMKNIPAQWKTNHTNNAKFRIIANNPTIVFFANSINTLLAQINTKENITKTILSGQENQDHFITLNKTRTLIESTRLEYTKNYGKPPSKGDNKIADMIIDAENKYTSTLHEIKNKLEYDLNCQIHSVVSAAFDNKYPDIDLIIATINQVKNFMMFIASFSKFKYYPSCDIVFIIANKINSIIAKGKYLTHDNAQNILDLIVAFYPKLTESDRELFLKKLNALPDILVKLQNESIASSLHYLCNYIETSLIKQENLSISLARHKHISDSYFETWDNTFNNGSSDNIDTMNSYIKNVSLRLIQISPTITLKNFDGDNTRIILDNFKNTINEQKVKNKNTISYINNLQLLISLLEKNMFEKINDIFQMKAFLNTQPENIISLEKLQSLLIRIDRYFTDTGIKMTLRTSINNTCLALLKNYVLSTIESEQRPDISYITNLNKIIDNNVLEKLCNENELKIILKSYIESYDGTKNNLSSLLIGLTSGKIRGNCENYLLMYANKRLAYIKSSLAINQDDYQFFSHFTHTLSMSKLFSQYKVQLEMQIASLTNNENVAWSSKSAYLIELFGNDNSVMQYRLKRIKELLDLVTKNQTDTNSDSRFLDFKATININRLSNGRLFKSNFAWNDKISVENYLNDVIANRPWSTLLEHIIAVSGTESHSQKLHFQTLFNILEHPLDFSENCLSNEIASPANTSENGNQEHEKQYYLKFIGESNIQKIIEKIEFSLNEIMRVAAEADSHAISTPDYEKITKLIASIKPFHHLYSTFGNSATYKNTIDILPDIHSKVTLRHELNTIFKNQLDILITTHNAESLQTAILDLTQTIVKIETSGMLTEKSIISYLSFCRNVLFTTLEKFIDQHANSLDFNSLSALINFLFYLPSGNIKALLLTAHKEQLGTNPHWLSLINHLDEEHSLNNLEIALAAAGNAIKSSPEFINTITFAKKYCAIKHQLNQRLKIIVLHESDIKLSNSTQIILRELLASKELTDKQLLKLWSAYAIKLTTKHLRPDMQTSYLSYLIKIICKISSAILSRSKDNPSLLVSLMDKFNTIFDIYHSIENLATPYSLNHSTLTLWPGNNQQDKLLQPVFSIIQKTYVMQLLLRTERYALKKISKDKLPVFRNISNDNTYNLSSADSNPNLASIVHSLGIKKDKNTIKVINALKIHHHLSEILNNNEPYLSLPDVLNTLLIHAPKKNHFALSNGYSSFLKELISLSEKCNSVINDKKMPASMSPQKSIFTLLKTR